MIRPSLFGCSQGIPRKILAGQCSLLKKLHEDEPATELVVSNQVVGEAYITLQYHYGIAKSEARGAILHLFATGSVMPLNGEGVIGLLQHARGPGLTDRLIAEDYLHQGVRVLTNDRRMAKLPGVTLLR